ncbi:hypothetical protein Q6A49_12615 [Pseudomonas sp. 22-AL-CL-001]|uniref:hypothetical protein n=1 Tax=Pseudomonas alabamensis TaxID=3064349 RepID=UPI002712EAD6|nr:hypothetical protein [Pseudomonas sp. 22-AL-CL-001]MDO7911376.1 hypothetical protein [Pseudomonas sp. 22-AL-CL-001]
MSKDTGGPAFPVEIRNTTDEAFIGCLGEEVKPQSFAIYTGVSVRDYFAAQALPTAWAAFDGGYFDAGEWEDINRGVVECAYQMADAMLAARVKP